MILPVPITDITPLPPTVWQCWAKCDDDAVQMYQKRYSREPGRVWVNVKLKWYYFEIEEVTDE